MFSWRCLRAIADQELKNFSLEWPKPPETTSNANGAAAQNNNKDSRKLGNYKFEGNIEELCLALYWPLKKRDIGIEAEKQDDENDEEDMKDMTEVEIEHFKREKEAK